MSSPCFDTGMDPFTVDQGDVDDDHWLQNEAVPFAPDIPSAFFKAPTNGVPRIRGLQIDRGALERF